MIKILKKNKIISTILLSMFFSTTLFLSTYKTYNKITQKEHYKQYKYFVKSSANINFDQLNKIDITNQKIIIQIFSIASAKLNIFFKEKECIVSLDGSDSEGFIFTTHHRFYGDPIERKSLDCLKKFNEIFANQILIYNKLNFNTLGDEYKKKIILVYKKIREHYAKNPQQFITKPQNYFILIFFNFFFIIFIFLHEIKINQK